MTGHVKTELGRINDSHISCFVMRHEELKIEYTVNVYEAKNKC